MILMISLSLSLSISDVRLVYCDTPASGTCCSKTTELKLASYSRNQLERNTKELVGKLASVLSARATRFNGTYHFITLCCCTTTTLFNGIFKIDSQPAQNLQAAKEQFFIDFFSTFHF